MSVVLLQHSRFTEQATSIHKAGCRDIQREMQRHDSEAYEYPSVAEAKLDWYKEMEDPAGAAEMDCRIHACAVGK